MGTGRVESGSGCSCVTAPVGICCHTRNEKPLRVVIKQLARAGGAAQASRERAAETGGDRMHGPSALVR